MRNYSIALIGLIFLVFSCKEDNSRQHPSNEVIFGFSTSSEGGRTNEEFLIDKLYVTIENESGDIVYDGAIQLNQFDESFESDPISLDLGSYQLKKFLVLDEDSVVRFATPIENSDLSHLVNDPLPIHFVVSKDDVTHVVPEVISVEEGSSEEFGYSSFSFEIVETFDLLIGVLAYDFNSEQYELTGASLTIKNGEDIVLTKALFPVTNKIVLSDRLESVRLVIDKDGYNSFEETFTIDSLMKHDGTNANGPLEIILENNSIDLTEGLIAYYPFNGNADDESVNDNHGVVNGAILSVDRNGVSDAAFSFDGVDDYIDLGNSELFLLGDYDGFTISAWVKSNEIIGTLPENRTIFSKYIAASDNRFYNFYIVDEHDLRFATWLNGAIETRNDVQYDIGFDWTHVAVVGNAQSYTLYLNGVEVGTSNKTFEMKTGTTTANAMIGAVHHSSTTFDRNFDGSIDEVRVYNRALLANEIQAIFNQ